MPTARTRGSVARARATTAVTSLIAKDPETFGRVSPPNTRGVVYPASSPVINAPGKGYFSLTPHKGKVDVGGIVGMPGSTGVVKEALNRADAEFPKMPQTLDAFDGHLPKIYGKHGFKEVGRLPFDPQYSPPHWDEKKMGRPDVVFMERPAAQQPMVPAIPRGQRGTAPAVRQRRMEELHLGVTGARPDLPPPRALTQTPLPFGVRR